MMRTSSKVEFEDERSQKNGAFPIWDCGSSLYDSHELVSLAYAIEGHMMTWPCLVGPKPIMAQLYGPHEAASTKSVTRGSSMTTSLSELLMKGSLKRMLTPQKKSKKHKKTKARFYGLVCGGNRLYSYE
ncbi:hypothetical protein RIF29_24117 [Crotalaria pallida]|uniref:Uncharacterized protein n=1 Tax=Crotalaria pallida TaxID=3830 RepID=A0AAN9EJR8_CROPI